MFSPSSPADARADRRGEGGDGEGLDYKEQQPQLALGCGERKAAPWECWFMHAIERNSPWFQLSALPCSQEPLP